MCWFVVKNSALDLNKVHDKQISTQYGVLRTLTFLIMHVQMVSEFDQGVKMMKYAVNHPWKFRSFQFAFLAGFMKFVIMLTIEMSNVYVVMAKGSESHFDIIGNFVIMLVLAEFDNFFYEMRSADEITRMLVETKFSFIFRWETTTSFEAAKQIEEN